MERNRKLTRIGSEILTASIIVLVLFRGMELTSLPLNTLRGGASRSVPVSDHFRERSEVGVEFYIRASIF